MTKTQNQYRVTKYNPEYRKNGTYMRDEWTSISDIGKNIMERNSH